MGPEAAHRIRLPVGHGNAQLFLAEDHAKFHGSIMRRPPLRAIFFCPVPNPLLGIPLPLFYLTPGLVYMTRNRVFFFLAVY